MIFSFAPIIGLLSLIRPVIAAADPLKYRNIPGYVASSSSNVTTLLDFIKSRSDLRILSEKINELGGFAQAFDTDPNWEFTFFAPNNDAFTSYTGAYFDSFEPTPQQATDKANPATSSVYFPHQYIKQQQTSP
ncbi:hypothetical protein CBS147346_1971 [Aspergillus niger]|nr:hypothetical protein CBS147346_1971 [Aspergillus niger]